MGRKRRRIGEDANNKMASAKKHRKSITLQVKMDVIRRFERGERAIDIQRATGLHEATLRTIRSNAETIKRSVNNSTFGCTTRISRKRSPAMEHMEKCLADWLSQQQHQNNSLTMMEVQKKAIQLYEELRNETDTKKFVASLGWFDKFKKRHNIANIDFTDGFLGVEYADDFLKQLKNVILKGGYTPQQVFNIAETVLFLKKNQGDDLRRRKDRCVLLLGSNAEGDLKLKPLVVHSVDLPKSLRNKKEELPVFWELSPKSQFTSDIFMNYFKQYLEIELRNYCEQKNLDYKILLILDNPSLYPVDVLGLSGHIRVVYLPTGTASYLQPMNRGIFDYFKSNCLKILSKDKMESDPSKSPLKDSKQNFKCGTVVNVISESWQTINPTHLNSSWKDIWPECVRINESDYSANDGLLVATGFLEVEMDDVQNLLESPTDTEVTVIKTEHGIHPMPLDRIGLALNHIDEATAILKDEDPNVERSTTVINVINSAISSYRQMLYADGMGYGQRNGTL